LLGSVLLHQVGDDQLRRSRRTAERHLRRLRLWAAVDGGRVGGAAHRHDRAHGDTRLRNQRRKRSLVIPITANTTSTAKICSHSFARRSTVSRYPSPSVAARSSATTSIGHAAARLTRATSIMPG